MKQLLFLLLFPAFVVAQYPGNGNQKITLGEQTTADGLVFRGLAADTTRKPSVDTMAYILLDTNTNIIWQYKKAVNNAWTRVGGSISSGLTGVLPLANGGTNNTSYIIGAIPYSNGTSLTSDTSRLFYDNANKRLGINTSVPTHPITINNNVSSDAIAFNNYNNKFSRAFFKTFSNSTLHPGNIGSNPGLIFERWNTNDLDESNTTAVVDGTGLGVIDFQGNAGSTRGPQVGGRISVDVEGGTSTYTGANMRILTNSSTTSRDATPQLFISYLGRIGILNVAPSEVLHVTGNARITGNIAAGVTSATARLHLAAGTATASTAPLKFTSGTNLTTAEAGAMEFNGTNLFFSPSTTRHTVNHGLTGSATLDFPSTTTLLSADLTITVTGAADGDVVSLGVPNAAVNANTCYTAWVSSANTVTIRFNNYSSGTVNPASGTFKVFVTK